MWPNSDVPKSKLPTSEYGILGHGFAMVIKGGGIYFSTCIIFKIKRNFYINCWLF